MYVELATARTPRGRCPRRLIASVRARVYVALAHE